jgi:hypothetical protein
MHRQTASQLDTAEERQLLQQVGLQMEASAAAMQAHAAAERTSACRKAGSSSSTAMQDTDTDGSSRSSSCGGSPTGSVAEPDTGCKFSKAAAHIHAHCHTAAPVDDVMWLFRHVLSMPPVEGLETLSMAELIAG